MKSEKLRVNSNERGITLIALVITVIVLLILAGVTINLTLGENGIFTTAQKAAKNYTEAQDKELEDMAYFTNTVDNISKGNTTLTSQITGADYGKYINYSVTVDGTVLDKWRVFYNDRTTKNVYIIYDGYLPTSLISEETGVTKAVGYKVSWNTDKFSTNTEVVSTLTNTNLWRDFSKGLSGAIAIGSPTNEMFVNSWNENPIVNSRKITVGTPIFNHLADSSKLYIPYTIQQNGCYAYWLASVDNNNASKLWLVDCSGNVLTYGYSEDYYALRPVVCLPSEVEGTIGSSVNIHY